jgi:hypothetical protein
MFIPHKQVLVGKQNKQATSRMTSGFLFWEASVVEVKTCSRRKWQSRLFQVVRQRSVGKKSRALLEIVKHGQFPLVKMFLTRKTSAFAVLSRMPIMLFYSGLKSPKSMPTIHESCLEIELLINRRMVGVGSSNKPRFRIGNFIGRMVPMLITPMFALPMHNLTDQSLDSYFGALTSRAQVVIVNTAKISPAHTGILSKLVPRRIFQPKS